MWHDDKHQLIPAAHGKHPCDARSWRATWRAAKDCPSVDPKRSHSQLRAAEPFRNISVASLIARVASLIARVTQLQLPSSDLPFLVRDHHCLSSQQVITVQLATHRTHHRKHRAIGVIVACTLKWIPSLAPFLKPRSALWDARRTLVPFHHCLSHSPYGRLERGQSRGNHFPLSETARGNVSSDSQQATSESTRHPAKKRRRQQTAHATFTRGPPPAFSTCESRFILQFAPRRRVAKRD